MPSFEKIQRMIESHSSNDFELISIDRDEYLDIPKRALREAIVNCYCHRDYTLSGDVKIEFYDDRVQIYSLESLPDGLTLENIKIGMAAKKNI